MNRVGRWRGHLCLAEGPVTQTRFAMLPRDMSEGTFPSVQAQTEWSLLEELIGSARVADRNQSLRTVQHFQLCDFIIGEYCYTPMIRIRAAPTLRTAYRFISN